MAEHPREPSLDVDFLYRWSPARILVTGIVVYAAFVLTSPLQYAYDFVTWDGVFYASVTILAFLIGCYVASILNGPKEDWRPRPFRVPLDRYINVTVTLAAFGVAARVFDRVYLRGFVLQETFEATRETASETVSFFGYLGGAFFAYGFIALALIWLSRSQQRRPVTFVLACLLASYPSVEALLQGSRSPVLHTAALVFFLSRSTRAMSWLVRSPISLVAIGAALLILFQLIFEIRTLEGGGYEETISEAYRLTGMAEFAEAPTWITDAIIATDGTGLVAGALKTFVHFEQYLTHSWLVFFNNFSNLVDNTYGWGRYHLSLPVRFVGLLVGEDLTYNPFLYGMNEGMFSTALSSIYYDFGPVGPLLAGLFGFAATRLQVLTIRYPELWLPLHSLVCLACAMLLIENPLLGGMGAFAIWGFLFYIPLHALILVLSRRSFASADEHVATDQSALAD